MQADENSATPTHNYGKCIALVVVLGLCVRLFDALSKSLWIDELQRLYFAGAESGWGVIGRVHTDFQAPGYYLLLHFMNGIDAPLLRAVSILASLVTLVPLLALCRSANLSSIARLAVAGVFCLAPYQVGIAAELSPYPFLQLVIVTLTWAAFTSESSARLRFGAFALATAAGLYLSYFAVSAVLAIGIARTFTKQAEWLRFRTLIAAGSLGVLAFVPWLMKSGESFARASRMAQTWNLHIADLEQASLLIPRTFMATMSDLDSPAAFATCMGAGIFFGVILVGLARRVFSRANEKPARVLVLRAAITTCVVAAALMLCIAPFLTPRIDENYYALSAWAWPLVAGALVDASDKAKRPRMVGLLLAGCAIAGAGHALGDSREDFKEAVRIAREVGEGRNAIYTGILAQPWRYSSVTAFDVYAPELTAAEPLDVSREAETVVIITRASAIDSRSDEWGHITGRRVFNEKINIDDSVWVYVYVKP